jgi:hypothetical protein
VICTIRMKHVHKVLSLEKAGGQNRMLRIGGKKFRMVIGFTVILTFPVTVVPGVETSKIVDRGLHSSKLSATIGGTLHRARVTDAAGTKSDMPSGGGTVRVTAEVR